MNNFDYAMGKSGHFLIHKYGRIPTDFTIGNLPVDVWSRGSIASSEAYPGFGITTAFKPVIVSSSTDDDDGGSGAEAIELMGLDADGNIQFEKITMNGTTNVNALKYFTAVFMCKVTPKASGETFTRRKNAGLITIKQSTNIVAAIEINQSQAEMCMIKVPKDYVAFVTQVSVNVEPNTTFQAATKSIHLQLKALSQEGIEFVKDDFGLATTQVIADRKYYSPKYFTELTWIWIQVTAADVTVPVNAGMDIHFVKKSGVETYLTRLRKEQLG